MGDSSFSAIVATYNTPSLHILFGPNIWAPTGAYTRIIPLALVSITGRLPPEMALTWFPQPAWEVSADMFTQFNSTNRATEYHSGKRFQSQFFAGMAATRGYIKTPNWGFQVLISSWADDTSHGVVVPTTEGACWGSVPRSACYFIPHGRVVLKWEHEFDVRNRPAGNRLWIGLANARKVTTSYTSQRATYPILSQRITIWVLYRWLVGQCLNPEDSPQLGGRMAESLGATLSELGLTQTTQYP